MINLLAKHCRLALEVATLPRARLCFDTSIHSDDVRETYKSFRRPHPKYKIFRHKQLGVALVDLRRHGCPQTYLDSIKSDSQGARYAKKARARGYVVERIDRNAHVDAIHDINISLENRQGRRMDASYQEKKLHYESLPHYRYYGAFSKDGRLMAYCNIGLYGNFAAFSQLLGYRNNDGVMHLMVSSVIIELLAELSSGGASEYVMYDTFFGAQPGLRQFKTMLGFAPYRVSYSLR